MYLIGRIAQGNFGPYGLIELNGTLTLTGTEGKSWVFPAVNRSDNSNIRVRATADVTVLEDIS